MYATTEYYLSKIEYLEKNAKKIDEIKDFINDMKMIKYVPTADYIFDEITKIIEKD